MRKRRRTPKDRHATAPRAHRTGACRDGLKCFQERYVRRNRPACARHCIRPLFDTRSSGQGTGRTRRTRKAGTAPPPRHARTAATPPESDGRAARHATGPDVFSPGPVVRISFPADGRDRPAVCSPTPVSSIRAGPRVPPSWHRPARNRCRCARPESPP